MEREFEPKFRAGAENWDLACDGQALLIRGKGAFGPYQSFHDINSIVPLLAISSFEFSTVNDAYTLRMSIWDGTDFTLHFTVSDLQPIETNIIRLAQHIKVRNLAWPLGSARAAAARNQTQPGYLRDRELLGVMGIEEFWSPLAEMPWHWAQLAAARSASGDWPAAALLGRNRNADALLVLYRDGLMVTTEEGPRIISTYRQLKAPSLEPGPSTGTAPVDTTESNPHSQTYSDVFGVMLQMHTTGTAESASAGEEMINTGPVYFSTDDQPLQNAYRYILYQWANSQVEGLIDAAQALEEAAAQLESGRLAPEAFSVLVDALIAHEAGVSLSSTFPPEERPYFPKPSAETPKKPQPTKAKPPPTRQAPKATSTTQNMRRAAAGAAGAAAIFGFMTD